MRSVYHREVFTLSKCSWEGLLWVWYWLEYTSEQHQKGFLGERDGMVEKFEYFPYPVQKWTEGQITGLSAPHTERANKRILVEGLLQQ